MREEVWNPVLYHFASTNQPHPLYNIMKTWPKTHGAVNLLVCLLVMQC